MSIEEFVSGVLALRSVVPFSVTSWGRTLARNKDVGGSPSSLHLLWMAVDVVLDDPKDQAVIVRMASRVGLRAIPESDHIHLESS